MVGRTPCRPLHINMVISILVGLSLGCLLVLVARPPTAIKYHVVIATGMGSEWASYYVVCSKSL